MTPRLAAALQAPPRPEKEHAKLGLKLTSYRGKERRPTGGASLGARTTVPGFVNAKGQQVVERTGARSTTFPGQIIYRMKCRGCSHEYGSNGCDIHARSCPSCQQGTAGEPLTEKPAGLFS